MGEMGAKNRREIRRLTLLTYLLNEEFFSDAIGLRAFFECSVSDYSQVSLKISPIFSDIVGILLYYDS